MAPPIPVNTAWPVRHGERAEARATARQNAPKGRKVKVDQSQCKERGAIVYNACRTCFVKSERSDLKRCGRCRNVWYYSPCVTRRISSARALISCPVRARRKIGQPTRRLAARWTSIPRVSRLSRSPPTSSSDVLEQAHFHSHAGALAADLVP
jgi:hypothetical protein